MLNQKWKRWVLGLFLLAGVSFTGLLFYLSHRLENIQGPLITFLKSHIHGEIKIDSAQVVFFPTGINLKKVTLYAPGESTPSADIDQVELRFRMIPLIQKKIETKITVLHPEIFLSQKKTGLSNMEEIFAPLLHDERTSSVPALENFWWKRLTVEKLVLEKGHFISKREGDLSPLELQNLNVEADQIRFESAETPAKIQIQFLIPGVSSEPMELRSQLAFQNAQQKLTVAQGQFEWGEIEMDFGGEVSLPQPSQSEPLLNLSFQSSQLSFEKLNSVLKEPLPLQGDFQLKGSIEGSAFSPVLHSEVDSSAITFKKLTLSQVHGEFFKKEEPVEVQTLNFKVYEGEVKLKGSLLPKEKSAQLELGLHSLSLAAISGKRENSARLDGQLQITLPDLQKPLSSFGNGQISAGPFPLPQVNLEKKMGVAEILATGTGMGKSINFDMLSSSANVIGTQIDSVKANLQFLGEAITLRSFHLENGHFHADGSGMVTPQKNIQAQGTFVLNSSVTAQLIPDATFRSALTQGSGSLSVPFTVKGPLENPQVDPDTGYLKKRVAQATLSTLKNKILNAAPVDKVKSFFQSLPLGR